MTVRTFDLNRSQICCCKKSVTVDINGSMAVLALHTFLIVNVLLHCDVVFCVQAGLVFGIFIEWRSVWCFHKALKRNANSFATVVACCACFDSKAVIGHLMNGDVSIAGSLNLMCEWMAGLGLRDAEVSAFVQSFVSIGDVAT